MINNVVSKSRVQNGILTAHNPGPGFSVQDQLRGDDRAEVKIYGNDFISSCICIEVEDLVI